MKFGPEATRGRVARTLLERGPATAGVLADELGLTGAAVRRHLEALEADGLVAPQEPRRVGPRGRGRPAKAYALTTTGRDLFDQAYDDLAVGALRYLAETGGPNAVASFAQSRVRDLEQRYAPVVAAARPAGDAAAVAALAGALTGDGYAASAQTRRSEAGTTVGIQLCQHHCPVAHAAEQFPQLCEAETEVFARLLGSHVQRLATIAHGDGVCTTHVPLPQDRTEPTRRRTAS